jgi:hypothetical protein
VVVNWDLLGPWGGDVQRWVDGGRRMKDGEMYEAIEQSRL